MIYVHKLQFIEYTNKNNYKGVIYLVFCAARALNTNVGW